VTTMQLDQRGRYGLIAELASRMEEHHYNFGKTALQKLVYLMQEVHGIDCGYEFTLYTYGPFSAQLLSDLDSTAAYEGVRVLYNDFIRGYQISPGPKNEDVRAYAIGFVEAHNDAIEEVVREFGGLTAKELELRATIVYVAGQAKELGITTNGDDTAQMVHDLKPHFEIEEIKRAFQQLHSKDYVAVQ
jgi:uncharacterized protein YwgA